jgi:hypothetical protein
MVTATGPIPPLTGIEPTARADEVHIAPPLPAAEPEAPDVAELSRLGALLGRLTDLQRTAPQQAQRALFAMASDLAGRAAMSGGDTELRALADAFSRAAQTGDLSEVRPPGPPRPGELIEGTAPNTATAQGQVASYALGQPPARPELGALLDDALSRTEPEQRAADQAAREQRSVEQTALEQRSADRAEQRRTEQVEQRRAEQAELDQRSVDQAELEPRRAEQVALEPRHIIGGAG